MLLHSNLWSLATVFLLIPAAFSQTIAPFSDGQCANQLSNFTYDDIEAWAPGFGLGTGYPSSTNYENLQFFGANSPNNAAGYTVYWKVSGIDRGCRVVFMTPFTEWHYGATSNDQIVGNAIVNVGSDGCYYTSLPVNTTLSTTFCCGTGDCSALSTGNSALIGRALHAESLSPNLIDTDKEDDIQPNDPVPVGSMISRALSVTRKPKSRNLLPRSTCTDMACFDAAWATCTITAGDPIPRAGSQVAISASQSCPADTDGVCSFAASSSLTTGTSYTTSSDTTITNENGVDLSVTAGVDWPVAAETTATGSYSFSKAVATSAGMSLDSSSTFTVTNTIGQVSGSKAFMTFTPSFSCYEPGVDCTNSNNPSFFAEVCWPNMLENGVQDGDYNLVYID